MFVQRLAGGYLPVNKGIIHRATILNTFFFRNKMSKLYHVILITIGQWINCFLYLMHIISLSTCRHQNRNDTGNNTMKVFSWYYRILNIVGNIDYFFVIVESPTHRQNDVIYVNTNIWRIIKKIHITNELRYDEKYILLFSQRLPQSDILRSK